MYLNPLNPTPGAARRERLTLDPLTLTGTTAREAFEY